MKTLIFIYVFLFGCIFGSFCNVLIQRIPLHEKIGLSRSHCMHCHHELSFWQMIPLISYLALKGRCAYCHQKIFILYPLIELSGGLTALACLLRFGLNVHALLVFFICELLIAMSLIDAQTMLVSDQLLLALAVFVLLDCLFTDVPFKERISGAVFLPLLLHLLNQCVESFGDGDIQLLLISGFHLGLKNSFIGFFVTLMLSSGYAVCMILRKQKQLQSRIAFIPFIAMGIFAVLFVDFGWF